MMDKGRTSRRDRTPIEVAAVAVDCAAVFVTEASDSFDHTAPHTKQRHPISAQIRRPWITSSGSAFIGAAAFNQNVDSWNTGRVTTLYCVALLCANQSRGRLLWAGLCRPDSKTAVRASAQNARSGDIGETFRVDSTDQPRVSGLSALGLARACVNLRLYPASTM